MNVTAPFKLDAFAWATERSARASLAGAVNALKFEGERVLAENFDGVGLTRDVVGNLGFALRGKRVLILGAGGATRGALLPFLEQAPRRAGHRQPHGREGPGAGARTAGPRRAARLRLW